MNYFESLQQDYEVLNFPLPHEQSIIPRMQPEEVKSYSDLHKLMLNLAGGVHGACYSNRNLIGIDTETLGLRTKFARHIIDMCQLDEMSRIPTHICPDGERLIATSMQPERIANPEKDSPIIVERDGMAIGVMKQLGDHNYFALEDDPSTSTYAGHFYRTKLEHTYYRPYIREVRDDEGQFHGYKMLADHAFTMSIDEVGEYVRPGMQFSIFMVPIRAREPLITISKDEIRKKADLLALRTSHDFLREVAQHALASAEPAHIGFQSRPGSLPEGFQEIRIDGKYQIVRC